MGNSEGWIKLHRDILHWEWYDNIPCRLLFIHCLLSANFAETSYRGLTLKRGQFLTSIGKLAQETGLSQKQVRNALGKLQSTNELQHTGTNKGSTVTVCNYESWQDPKLEKGTQKASKGQAEGKQGASKGQHNKKGRKKEGKNNTPCSPPSGDGTPACEEQSDLDLKGEELPPPLPYSSLFAEAWSEWMAYRKECKFPYKSPKSEIQALKKLRNLTETDAIRTIYESIANGWRGLFPEKLTPTGSGRSSSMAGRSRNTGTANDSESRRQQIKDSQHKFRPAGEVSKEL